MMAGDAAGIRAMTVAAMLAVDPAGLGGATLRARAGPIRDSWIARFRLLLSPDVPWKRLPPGIPGSRLVGGLDLAATLGAGRPVAERGLLVEADGGIILAPMAERLGADVIGPLCATMDSGLVVVERDGMALRHPSRFGTLLLDEGLDDERAPPALSERLAFIVDFDGVRGFPDDPATRDRVVAARDRLGAVVIGDDLVTALCEVGLAFGVGSLRPTQFALRAAKVAAALAGRDHVLAEDVTLAAALVLASRATTLPADHTADPSPEEDEQEAGPPPPDAGDADAAEDDAPPDAKSRQPETGDRDDAEASATAALTDHVVAAAKAAIPAGLLEALTVGLMPGRHAASGRAGAPQQSARRGRPAGVRRGMPGPGARLALIETLRAAAPWQALRRQAPGVAQDRVLVRREDFRIGRYKQKGETATIFVVDASGSTALNRLAEVKGAVELILAECYVRRDAVALIAFRGTSAELILPPTRSLARAKRALAGQAGGGGTPLATAIDTATALADTIRRKGPTPLAVFLTDGRANIGRTGQAGRAEAEADALASARTLRATGFATMVIDISPRPNPAARHLAVAMGARYQPLPHVDARVLSRAVLAASEDIARDHRRNV